MTIDYSYYLLVIIGDYCIPCWLVMGFNDWFIGDLFYYLSIRDSRITLNMIKPPVSHSVSHLPGTWSAQLICWHSELTWRAGTSPPDGPDGKSWQGKPPQDELKTGRCRRHRVSRSEKWSLRLAQVWQLPLQVPLQCQVPTVPTVAGCSNLGLTWLKHQKRQGSTKPNMGYSGCKQSVKRLMVSALNWQFKYVGYD